MIRHVAAVAVFICLSPSSLLAQSPQFTVKADAANVHKSPSTGSPVIGKVFRGTVLTVTRELGSWVRISWPAAQDGVGFVHMNTGTLANGSLPVSRPTAGRTTPSTTPTTAGRTTPSTTPTTSIARRPAPEVPPPATTGAQAPRPVAVAQPAPAPGGSGSIPHFVGLGGRMGGSTLGLGASARASVGHRFRVQLEVSRYTHSIAVAQPRLTSVQIAPSLLYSLPDRVTDYVWVRPYFGGGMAVYRSTLSSGTSAAGTSLTDRRFGRQIFGGVEVAFASAPRFSVSTDFGYRWPQTPFVGFELGGQGLSVSGHYYVK
jgi:Bacterial SH3 domain